MRRAECGFSIRDSFFIIFAWLVLLVMDVTAGAILGGLTSSVILTISIVPAAYLQAAIAAPTETA